MFPRITCKPYSETNSFVHGGGWRDPRITATSFSPTIDAIYKECKHSHWLEHVTAFASIDYRLSPHPRYPQDPKSTPEKEYRDAVHPDHVKDVKDGIEKVLEKYGVGAGEYIVVGHSVGATMAFWCGMGEDLFHLMDGKGEKDEIKNEVKEHAVLKKWPYCIVGVAGIYDIPTLINRHKDETIYRQFVEGALGRDEQVWKKLSPVLYQRWKVTGKNIKQIILAHSETDGMVEMEQVEDMEKTVKDEWDTVLCKRVNISGQHDEVWEQGAKLAAVVELAVKVAIDL
jgi:hypothetical protein